MSPSTMVLGPLKTALIIGVMAWACMANAQQQDRQEQAFALRPDGTIPAWIVAGPFEQSTTGFGVFADVDAIGERSVAPLSGKSESSPMVEQGHVMWREQSVDAHGYLDFNATLGWAVPAKGPEKLVTAKAGYAFCFIDSPDEREALLLLGSNSELRLFVNGNRVYATDAVRNAVRDNDTVRIQLRPGKNTLLLKIGNTHRNYWLTFFGVPEWGWGLFARLTRTDRSPMNGLRVLVPLATAPSYALQSTFFFKRQGGELRQRIDLVLHSPLSGKQSGSLHLDLGGRSVDVDLPDIAFGESRTPFYLTPISADTPVHTTLRIGPDAFSSVDTIRAEQQYELHLMFLTHTDIGYTNPQPVVKERHLKTLDDVLEMCAEYPEFRWTLETVWQLKEYEKARPRWKFLQLIDLIRKGRVALSPIYSNPFTGMVSQEEMIRALRYGEGYSREYGFPLRGAVYNDVPGLSWFVPQALKQADVSFLVCGLDELFNDYSFQRALPKAFQWEGSDGTRVLTYLTETYNEGAAYGLERNPAAIEQRTWERLNRLRANGYAQAMVLLNAAQGDNAGVARTQFLAAKKWNEEYAYPKFVFTTLNDFAESFTSRYAPSCPTVRGDWTSTWDILFQGEPARMIRERWSQHHLLVAEKLATIAALLDSSQTPLGEDVQRAYDALLHFSGHGSGLEAGYGTRSENAVTMQFREQYIRDAWLRTEEILERSVTRLAAREEDFESAGALVFNTLAWRRDVPMALELKDSSSVQYEVTDLVTGKTVPSYREGYWVYLVAPQLPSVGFKKFRAGPHPGPASHGATDLVVEGDTIENAFYRVTFDRGRQCLSSIDRKADGQQLIDQASAFPFGGVVRRRQFANERFAAVPPQRAAVRIIDQRPVRIVVEWSADSGLAVRRRVILWSGLDRVDLACTVNLGALAEPSTPEEYCLAFPFALCTPTVRIETQGGFLDPARDRFPGIAHNGYSIRRCVSLSDTSSTVALACVDNRVVFLEDDTARGRTAVLVNLVNNFPKAWNRNEENAGQWEFRISLRGSAGAFDAASVSRFGWDAVDDPAFKVTFFRSRPGERSFFSVSSRSVLLTAFGSQGTPGEYFMRLVNVDPVQGDVVRVASEFLGQFNVRKIVAGRVSTESVALEKGALSLRLGPNECATVLLEEKRRSPARK